MIPGTDDMKADSTSRMTGQRLRESAIFRDYQEAFENATGLPLQLHAVGEAASSLRERQRSNAFCSLMAHVDVGGGAHFETGCYLGTKATVIQGIRVGAYSTLGAGAVAVRDIPAGCTAVGVPAKVIKN